MDQAERESLTEDVRRRLDADELVSENVAFIVLAALEGTTAIDAFVEDGALPEGATKPPLTESPKGAYVTSLTVEGFRGIGAPAALDLKPGPGLTLIIGRNGSGKSSFAEALEVLFTGDNQRWARRSAVWREGWRNLHHSSARIEAELAVEGYRGTTTVRRVWANGADLESSVVEIQPHGQPKTGLGFLGWGDALSTYRPFLSYSELGSMLDEGPSKLFDAVSLVLGLDELAQAEKALRDARLARERVSKQTLAERDQICVILEDLDDERARATIAALRPREMNLDVVERLIASGTSGAPGSELQTLQRVAAYDFVDEPTVAAAAAELRDSQHALAELVGTEADRLLRSADLLDEALAFRAHFAEDDCPVCGTRDVLSDEWAAAAERRAEQNREAAQKFANARSRADRAFRRARELLGSVPSAIQDSRGLLDVDELLSAWTEWVSLETVEDPDVFVARLEPAAVRVRGAVAALKAKANDEVARRQDVWRPVALTLADWVGRAKTARAGAKAVPDLKSAEAWLKKAGVELRNERFAPIAGEAIELWRLLRQRSNIQLGSIELEGTGTRRHVTLHVTVDGVAGAALGVMSQGELHALALSLFFPRATLDESPFRFIVIDDPVQSMDPSKVDGLARVLDRSAKDRQVIVFTHDDRLPEAIRRLGIDSTILEVTRRENSEVEVREALTPVERHIDDARAICATDDLPIAIAQRVVPGFCRLAIEAACSETIRRRRIGRGEPHADVEQTIASASRVTQRAALALFDDVGRGGDVLPYISSKFGSKYGDTFRAVGKGAHQGMEGDLRDLVRDAAVLARQISEVK